MVTVVFFFFFSYGRMYDMLLNDVKKNSVSNFFFFFFSFEAKYK